MSELKEKTARGLFWGGFSNGIQQLLNLLFGIVLARLLTPSDYGMVGMLSIFVMVASTLQDCGFTNALANKKEVSHADYNAVFWFSTLMGVLLYLLLFLSAPLIAAFFGQPELESLSRLLFLGFLISSTDTAHNAVFFKQLMVKQKAMAQLIALCVSGVTGITLALCGMAYWGIALQTVTYIAVCTGLYWCFSPWRPSLEVDFRPLRPLFGFSSKLLLTNLFTQINNNLLSALLGHLYAAREVGHYTQANKWTTMGHVLVANMVNGVAQPVFAQVADDQPRQRQVFRKLLRFTSFISFPALLGLALIAPELIHLALTDKWMPCVPLLRILCIWSAFLPIQQLYYNLIISHRRSNVVLTIAVVVGVLQLLLMALIYPYGITWMVTTSVALHVGSLLLWHDAAHRAMGLTLAEALRDILPFAGIALGVMGGIHLLMTWLQLSPLPTLLLKIALGALLYLGLMAASRAVVLRETIHFILKKKPL